MKLSADYSATAVLLVIVCRNTDAESLAEPKSCSFFLKTRAKKIKRWISLFGPEYDKRSTSTINKGSRK